jgi:hypothetical protein
MSRVTIKNFREELPVRQVKKGQEYFESGAVSELTGFPGEQWEALVESTETYSVHILLKGTAVKDTVCDCPVETPFCKHVIAVLFAIEEELAINDLDEKEDKAEIHPFTDILKRVKHEEMRLFLEEYGKKNKEFRTSFLLRFADQLKSSGKEKYETLISNILKAGKSHNGLYEFQAVQKMARQLEALITEAHHQLANRNYLDPFHLAQTLITKVNAEFEHAEDTGESLRGCMVASLEILESILDSDAALDLKEEVYEFAFHEAVTTNYIRPGLDDEWFQILMAGAADRVKKEKLLEVFDQRVNEARKSYQKEEDNWLVEGLLRRKMEVLSLLGRKEEAHKVMTDNMRIRAFRLQLIEELIAAKDFDGAKEIIKNSKLGDQQKGRLYESIEWEKLLLKIAMEEKDTAAIRNLSLNLFRSGHDMDYYRLIRSTYAKEEWPNQMESIIDSIRTHPYFSFQGIKTIAEILKEEKEWPRLLQLVEKNASLKFVDEYAPLIKDHYPEEVVAIYKEALRRYAEQNMGTEHYKRVAATLVKMQSLPTGKEVAKALAIEFKVKYRQRRNMVNELNRLVF